MPSITNNTLLRIGPLTFSHQVQKITIQESKSVTPLETTRSKKNFLIDSGDSSARAQIRFLFTGLDEINGNGVFEITSTYDRSFSPPSVSTPLSPTPENYLVRSKEYEDRLSSKKAQENQIKFLELLLDLSKLDNGLQQELIELQSRNQFGEDGRYRGEHEPRVLALLEVAKRNKEGVYSSIGNELEKLKKIKRDIDTLEKDIDFIAKAIEEKQNKFIPPPSSTPASTKSDTYTTDSLSCLRGLIALFKCSPIINIENQYISSSWKKADKIYNRSNYKKLKDYLEQVSEINKQVQKDVDSLAEQFILAEAEGLLAEQFIAKVIPNLNTKQKIDNYNKDKAAVAKNEQIVKEINDRLLKQRSGAKPDILKGVDQFNNYSFGSVAFPDNFLKENVYHSRSISVALESIELESVPDIPQSIQVTLTIARIDTEPFTEGGELKYSGINSKGVSTSEEDPAKAFWLRKWITVLLEKSIVPSLNPDDFREASFDFYGKTAIGTPISDKEPEKFKLQLGNIGNDQTNTSDALLIAESCSLRHRFAFNKILGKVYPTVAHMGSTSRFMSLDIVFNNQFGYETYDKFCKFKYTSDEINKERERFDRITGWEIITPICKLLSDRDGLNPRRNKATEKLDAGVFVPLTITTENGNQPDMINCRIDLIENNVDFFSDSEIVLEEGSGTDYEDLEKFYYSLVKQEVLFREKLNVDPSDALRDITGEQSSEGYEAYTVFWPVEKGVTRFKSESGFGMLNIDTIRAVLMYLDDPGQPYGGTGKLRQALIKSPLASGEVVANRKITAIDKVIANLNFIFSSGFGIEAERGDLKEIYRAVKDLVDNKFFNFPQQVFFTPVDKSLLQIQTDFDKLASAEKLKQICTNGLVMGLLGDRTSGFFFNNSATGIVVANISKSNVRFSEEFKKALLRVLVERKAKFKGLPYIYSTDGIYQGFYKFMLKYSFEKDMQPDTPKPNASDIVRRNVNKGSASVYPDILLPTYRQLYGDSWTEFAPTVEDLGIVVPVPDKDGPPESPPLAVSEDDFVSPASWFYIKRNKKDLKTVLKKACDAVNEASPKLAISTPFNSDELEELKKQLETRRGALPKSTQYQVATDTISEIIANAFIKQQTNNPSAFREDVVNILAMGKRYEDMLIEQEGAISLHFKYKDTYAVPKEVTTPGLAAEIIRVVQNAKFLETNTPALLDPSVEATYVTPLEKEAAFLRGSVNNTFATTKSCIDQIADDHTSPERMFPAIKIYLVDRRGNDLIADDTLFNVNAIVSVDITMDKDDAPVAVIKLADPLFFLQSSYFAQNNVVYGGKSAENSTKDRKIERVFNSLRGPDRDSFLKRYKIAQGRAVQIRMGYSSMPFNLPIVFTGRISEIAPGDELTIVCQGWKAELINRQVNFYNDNPRNWGARDLAIQAIQYANPEGFGDYFPEFDAQFILKNMDPQAIEIELENTRRNSEGVDVEGYGTRTFIEGISNWFSTYLTYTSTEKRDLGFDTRLKNIWYPDTQLYYNVLNFNSLFNVMPPWTNDSWIIPAQPAWNVLKEASRHAWNCVVDVVPYDSYATIFMGHPDMPYYYTRGDSYSRKGYRKFKSKNTKSYKQGVDELLGLFYGSIFFKSDQPIPKLSVGLLAPEPADFVFEYTPFASLPTLPELEKKIDTIVNSNGRFDSSQSSLKFQSFLGYIFLSRKDLTNFSKGYSDYASSIRFNQLGFSSFYNSFKVADDIILDGIFNKSKIPTATMDQVIQQGSVTPNLPELLFSLFYGIPLDKVKNSWPNANTEIRQLLDNLSIATVNEGIKEKIETVAFYGNRQDDPTEIFTNIQDQLNTIQQAEDLFIKEKQNASAPRVFARVDPYKEAWYKLFFLIKDNEDLRLEFQKLEKMFPTYVNNITVTINELASIASYMQQIYRERQMSVRAPQIPADKTIQASKSTIELSSSLLNLLKGDFNSKSVSGVLAKLMAESNNNLFGENILETLPYFKGFVFYFCSFLKENEPARKILQNNAGFTNDKFLPPNMKVFRVHHFADDTHNIISNNIVASTKEMWNTVVIEHPSPGKANNNIQDPNAFNESVISSGANWIYWPKQEITGVMGLQFHPTLTLSNKKIKVFTELNCQSTDLAAKLACHHLAEGIKLMYRGNLSMLGKHMKPHDRIILADKYTRMQGPVEIQSLVHHWNADQGWITNIIPHAVCEANPASSVLQMAVLESTYQTVFNTIDLISEVLTYATIISTLGAATPFAIGAGYSARKGALSVIKGLLSPKKLLGRTAANWKTRFGEIGQGLGEAWKNGNTFNLLTRLYREVGGPVNSLFLNEVFTAGAQWGVGFFYKHNLISSFIENQQKVEQLPVILSPLLFNGNPFTAGLETEDSIWSIGSFGAYYSWKELQAGASRVWEDLFEE